MRVVIAECSVVYVGRGDSTLAKGVRAILIKSDGSVSIHNDHSNKPLNYMKSAVQTNSVNTEGEEVWTFDARHETIRVTIHNLINSFEAPLLTKDTEPNLVVEGTEAQLQAWLFENPERLGHGFIALERELQTGAGPVDILAFSPDGTPIAVEVKRIASLGAADQVRRYVEAMRQLPPAEYVHPSSAETIYVDFSKTVGLIAALDLRPRLQTLALKRGLDTVELPHYWREDNGAKVDS